MPDTLGCDVAVLGGGPAGVVTARGLARGGRRVVLIGAPRGHAGLEGLSPRTREALRAAGCDAALAQCGPEVRRVVFWNGERTTANVEHLVERADLDAALADDAWAAGVIVLGARVGGVGASRVSWRVEASAGRASTRVVARFLVEARGRAAPTGRVRRRGPVSLALVGTWTAPRAEPGTAVFAFDDGWCWIASRGHGQATIQVVIAGGRGVVPARRDLATFYGALLRRVPESAPALARARLVGAVHARVATSQLSARPVGPTMLRVGDAACAVDPLSGHGIFHAVAGGLAAVPVVQTLLERPGDRAAAAFWRARVAETFATAARAGRDVHRVERRFAERPFWRVRQAWPAGATARRARGPVVAWRPVVEDGFVVRREVVVTDDQPRGVWHVDGVPVVPLLRAIRGARRRRDAALEFARTSGAPAAAVPRAVAWLQHAGLLPASA